MPIEILYAKVMMQIYTVPWSLGTQTDSTDYTHCGTCSLEEAINLFADEKETLNAATAEKEE